MISRSQRPWVSRIVFNVVVHVAIECRHKVLDGRLAVLYSQAAVNLLAANRINDQTSNDVGLSLRWRSVDCSVLLGLLINHPSIKPPRRNESYQKRTKH